MPTGRSDGDGDDDDDDTPPTRSYVDALLRGNLSVDQVKDLRAEIAGRSETEPARLPRSHPPPSGRPGPPASAPKGAPPPAFSSRPPAGPSTMPPLSPRAYSVRPPSSSPASPRSYSPPDPAPYVLPPIEDYGSSYGPGPQADPRAEPDDDDDMRTMARAPRTVAPDEDDDDRAGLTAVHIYSQSEIADLVDLGDLGGLGAELGHNPPLRAPADEYDDLLGETFLSALGGAACVPRVALTTDRVTQLPLGPQAAFVLSHVDGASSIEDVLDVSGLARLETLRILFDLLQSGVIRVPG